MKSCLSVAILSWFAISHTCLAQGEGIDVDARLAKLHSQFEELRADAGRGHLRLNELYSEELGKLELTAKSVGNLDLVLAIQEEAANFATRKTPPTLSKFPELARLQRVYAEQSAAADAAQREQTTALLNVYLKQLTELQTELTKADQIADAVKVKSAIEELKKDWESFATAPPAPTAITPLAPPGIQRMRPGLVKSEYPRRPTQAGGKGFIPYTDLVGANPPESRGVVNSISGWGYTADKNAVAAGYLKIDQPGEYVFNSISFYDRNALYIDKEDKPLCGYRDGEGKEQSITLSKGMVRIISIGYVDARGSCRVRWKPPGQEGLSPIPEELLFHSSEDLK